MARFRGTVRGARSECSRLGHSQSGGVTTNANAWGIGIRASAHASGDKDLVTIEITGGSNARHASIELGTFYRLADGTLASDDSRAAAILRAIRGVS